MLAAPLLALLLSPAAPAQVQGPIPKRELRCELVLSTDLGVEDRWYYTPWGYEVKIAASGRVFRHQFFGVYLFFADYALTPEGLCSIEYDVSITRPDGSSFYESSGLPGYSGPVGSSASTLFSQQGVFACFEPEDPLGAYTVSVEVRDLVGETSFITSTVFTQAEYVEGAAFESEELAYAALFGRGRMPVVEQIIPAFLTLARSADWESSGTKRGSFRAVFETNHWLLARLLQRYADQDEATRRAILWLLARSSFDGEDSGVRELDPELWEELASSGHDPLVDPIEGRTDLNELWGMYAATRHFQPFLRLCLALSPETGVVADETVRAKGQDIDVSLSDVVQGAVESMLESDLSRDPFSRQYGLFLAANEGVPQEVRGALTRIYGE